MSKHDAYAQFTEGSILRLKVKNFLTYNECEVVTGPRLNLVIGPNGSGKSALTHALCLACCGSTGDVGRSTDLSKFVKHGAEGQESYVEVDILSETRSVVTIRRGINSENKGSKWFLNGKPAKQADVKALVSRLSIDVDNLCSFMPQDKVGNFSRFTPKEMLSNTLSSIQNSADQLHLADEQQALSKVQDAKEEYRRQRDAKQASLNTSKRDLVILTAEMGRMKHREEKQKLLQDYELRLLKVEISDLLQQEQDQQDAVDELTAQLQEEKRKIAPLEVRERELKIQQTARDKAADTAQTMQRMIDDSLRTKKEAVEQCGMSVDYASRDLTNSSQARAAKEHRLQQSMQQLDDAQREWEASLVPVPQLNADAAKLKEEQGRLSDHKENVEDQVKLAERLCGEQRDEVVELKKQFSSLQDSSQLFRAKLEKAADLHSRQVLTAMDWLDNNQERLRQSGHLRSEVYGPVARYCTVADPACAVMLEKAVPYNKFMGFVVDNDADASFLKDEFRINQGLHIDIYTMKRVILDVPRIYPDKMIRELGLTGYLSDQLVCPDIIRALFYSFHQLHKVLWGRGVDNLPWDKQVRLCQVDRGGFKLYIHETAGGGSSHSSRGGQQQMSIIEYKGKFGRDPRAPPSTSSVGVTGRGIVQRSGGGEDVQEQRAALQARIAEANANLKTTSNELDAHREELAQVQAALQKNKAQQATVRTLLSVPTTTKNTVDQFKRKVAAFRQELATDALEERAELVADYEQAIQKLFDAAQDTVKLVQRSTAQKVERMVTARLKDELLEAFQDVTAELEAAKGAVKELSKQLTAAQKERDEAQRSRQAKENDLDERIRQSRLTPAEFDHRVYRPILEHCPEKTVVDIQARMEQLLEDINRTEDNPLLEQRFAEVTEDVRRLERQLAQAAEEFDNAEEALHERSQKWLTQVREVTAALNTKFSAYMSDLQLGGEVKLREIGKFDDYEMQLRVKFRENSEMSELDGQKNSGGERAVSTAMFLMALQDMTSSPFRVLDEINQGMDECNERLVFDRIIKSCCCGASKSQYFLVTPKLLQGLVSLRHDDVNILLVWNGPGAAKKWDFRKILKKLTHLQSVSHRPLSLPHSVRHEQRASSVGAVGDTPARPKAPALIEAHQAQQHVQAQGVPQAQRRGASAAMPVAAMPVAAMPVAAMPVAVAATREPVEHVAVSDSGSSNNSTSSKRLREAFDSDREIRRGRYFGTGTDCDSSDSEDAPPSSQSYSQKQQKTQQ